jgi:hypothetical protein
MLGMLGSNKINSNFSKEQLKGILRALTVQLARLEQEGDKQEVRAKMLDISHYNNLWYNVASWDEYVAFEDELCNIRNA